VYFLTEYSIERTSEERHTEECNENRKDGFYSNAIGNIGIQDN
jgi:hypothetical protein